MESLKIYCKHSSMAAVSGSFLSSLFQVQPFIMQSSLTGWDVHVILVFLFFFCCYLTLMD